MQSTAMADVFVSSGLVSEEQLAQALDKQRQLKTQEPIGDLLVSMGLITERDRVRCLGEQWGVPYVDLTEIQIRRRCHQRRHAGTGPAVQGHPHRAQRQAADAGDEEPAGHLRH